MKAMMKKAVPFLLVLTVCTAVLSENGHVFPQAMVEPVGGISLECVALGILTGIAVGTGQLVAAGGFLLQAGLSGCLW